MKRKQPWLSGLIVWGMLCGIPGGWLGGDARAQAPVVTDAASKPLTQTPLGKALRKRRRIGLGMSHTTWPRIESGIPVRDYQFGARSQPQMVLSMEAIPVRRDASEIADSKAKRINLYQVKQSRIPIDHCSISRVALQLHSDGYWVLSLRADQNPQDEEVAAAAAGQNGQNGKVTVQFLRNQFVVKLRCYGAYKVPEERADETTGKPVLLEIGPEQFWVQSGQPKDFVARGKDDDIVRYFDLIDRVEVEFYYRKAQADRPS